MAVPSFLIVLCFLLLMALGVLVVFKVLRNPPHGGQSEFSLLGSKLSLKGPAWLIMLAIGVLMVAAPILVAAVERRVVTPFQPPAPATAVAKIS